MGAVLPWWLKGLLASFASVFASYNVSVHGVGSLLYVCDVGLFLATLGICLERRLLVSMAAVGVLLIQLAWIVDFASVLLGYPMIGMTRYVISDHLPLVKRAFSLFHAWLPVVLLFALSRLGYDRKGAVMWTALAGTLLLISYFALPPPPAPSDQPLMAVNINYVYGLGSAEPQTYMPPLIWLSGMMVVLTAFVFYPTHVVLAWWFGGERRQRAGLTTPRQRYL